MISHRNVIANVVQMWTYESLHRKSLVDPRNQSDYTETVLGLLPLSHIYGLIVIAHLAVYRGDGAIILPKFEFKTFLESIQKFKIEMLYLVGYTPVQQYCRLADVGKGSSHHYSYDEVERHHGSI